ncbi:hypothetical protein COCSADRAFT_124907, partial [Bipolaris sorokiniana ND90Pr]
MEARVNPTIQKIRGSTGLHIAVERMQEPTLIQLSGEHSADVKATNDDGTTLIHLAAANEHAPVLEYLLQNGANAETIYKNKRTPLIAAARHGKGFTHDLTIITRLLENNANPNLYSRKRGENPVQMAIRKDMGDVLESLVEKGANLSYQDIRGRGVLSYAIARNSIEILLCLCGQSIDVNNQDNARQTPLIFSTIGGIQVAVSRLIDSKAYLLLKDIRGRDALYWA